MTSHDHNFKNLFLDFPRETLALLLPQAEQTWGNVQSVEFLRQEPKKHNLSDPSLELDMPILFKFENQQLLLWLVEFQEDKAKFSIYKLLRYTTDLMESHPEALVIPAVLFTDRKKWRKSVTQKLHGQFNDRLFLHFEYLFCKLFDFNARDYYNIDNPVVKILLPKMHYDRDERTEVIRQAYSGLFQLVSIGLFCGVQQFCCFYLFWPWCFPKRLRIYFIIICIQNQAFNAFLFFFRHALGKEFCKVDGVVGLKENFIFRLYFPGRKLISP